MTAPTARWSRQDSGLGVLSDPKARVLGATGARERPGLSTEVRDYLESNGLADRQQVQLRRSQVHRRVHMDYIGIKMYDGQGAVCAASTALSASSPPARTAPIHATFPCSAARSRR